MAPRNPSRSKARRVSGSRPPASDDDKDFPGDRVAKVVARAGLGSRRDVEAWIADGRVAVNGSVIDSPALNVTATDLIEVDGRRLPPPERTRLWLYHKPRGLMTTEVDPEGRPTVFESLPRHLPRVLSIGRLDFNTEGLLLLTNDGGLKRLLELPATGWMRRYKVRAYGEITPDRLDALAGGITVEGIEYGPVEARIQRVQGENTWILMGIREGKNREIKNILGALGLEVNRLIRLSYGPFQLGELEPGGVEEIPARILADQLGPRLAEEAGVDFAGPRAEADTEPTRKPRRRSTDDAEPTPDPRRRATAKAERFARMQAAATAPETEKDEAMEDDDTPDVELDPETGKITLKPKTVADRKGRKVEVTKRFDPDRAPKRRPRVFSDDGEELRERRDPAPRRDDEERPPRRERSDDRPRTHAFRDDRRAPASEDGLRRRPPRRDDDRQERPRFRDREDRPRDDRPRTGGGGGFRRREEGEAGGDRPRSFGYRDRGGPPRGEGGDDRPRGRAFGFRDRPQGDGPPRDRPRFQRRDDEGRGDDRPRGGFRRREEGEGGGDRPRKPYRPRGEGGEERPRAPYRPRGEGGEERPRSSFRPREERAGGGEDRPRKPYRPRGEGGGEDRPRGPYRPRGEGGDDRPRGGFRRREEGGDDRPRGGFRSREDRGGGGDRPRGPYRPRGEGGDDRPRGGFRRREEGGDDRPRGGGGGGFRAREDRGGGGEDRPRKPFRPRGAAEDRGGEDRPRRGGFSDRPPRQDGDRPRKPYRPRGEGGGDRPPPRGGGGGRKPPRRDG